MKPEFFDFLSKIHFPEFPIGNKNICLKYNHVNDFGSMIEVTSYWDVGKDSRIVRTLKINDHWSPYDITKKEIIFSDVRSTWEGFAGLNNREITSFTIKIIKKS